MGILVRYKEFVTTNPAMSILHEYYLNNPYILAVALVNGYEVEQTPEDKVRERYSRAVADMRFHREKCQIGMEKYFDGYTSGIFDCLDDLNIKIEGVNANDRS
jgi:hypothetical protein